MDEGNATQVNDRFKPVRKTEFAGIGCVLQGAGILLLLFALPSLFMHKQFIPNIDSTLLSVGMLIGGLLCLHYGDKKASWYVCSNCGNRLPSKKVKKCLSCGAYRK